MEKGIQLMQIHEYLSKVLENSRYAGIELQKSPLGYNLTIKTGSPGLVIGRKGMRIKELSQKLSKKFGLENPEIEVEAVDNPDLNAQIMAESLAYGIKKGQNYRRTAYSVMRRIMRAGARGVEIIISGKSTSQRARTNIFRNGIISKCGGPALEGVDKGLVHVVMKSGTIGIRVKIMPLSYKLPDEIILKDPDLKKKLEEHKKRSKAREVEGGDVLISKSDSTVIIDSEKGEESIFDDLEEEAVIENTELENLEVTDDIKKDTVIIDKTEETPVETEEKIEKEKKPKKKASKKKKSVKKTDKKSEKKSEKSEKKTDKKSKKKASKKKKTEEKEQDTKTDNEK